MYHLSHEKRVILGTSRWPKGLRLYASIAGGVGSIPNWGIPDPIYHGTAQNKKASSIAVTSRPVWNIKKCSFESEFMKYYLLMDCGTIAHLLSGNLKSIFGTPAGNFVKSALLGSSWLKHSWILQTQNFLRKRFNVWLIIH